MLTKHCTGCGRNLGINWFFVDEDGNWSERCKFCDPIRPTPANAKTAYNSWTTEQLIAKAKKRRLL